MERLNDLILRFLSEYCILSRKKIVVSFSQLIMTRRTLIHDDRKEI